MPERLRPIGPRPGDAAEAIPYEPMTHWVAADPTNRTLTGAGYVKIGHGRAYSDVPPIRGVFRGGATSSYEAKVRMSLIGDG